MNNNKTNALTHVEIHIPIREMVSSWMRIVCFESKDCQGESESGHCLKAQEVAHPQSEPD